MITDNVPECSETEAFLTASLWTRPARQDSASGGVCAAILLWAIARALRAQIVVESDALRGFTIWALRQAGPQATQYAFDITLAERKWSESGVSYHETNWMYAPITAPDCERAMVYFDNNLPAEALYNDGLAAVLSVDMLFDHRLVDGRELCWRTGCGSFNCYHNATQATRASGLVEAYVPLPDLRFVYGTPPPTSRWRC